jgi:hypothetical protein
LDDCYFISHVTSVLSQATEDASPSMNLSMKLLIACSIRSFVGIIIIFSVRVDGKTIDCWRETFDENFGDLTVCERAMMIMYT